MVIVFAIIMASAFALKEIAGSMDFSLILMNLSKIKPMWIMGILCAIFFYVNLLTE